MFRHRIRAMQMRSRVARGGSRGRRSHRRWALEGLEGRVLLSGSPTVYIVTDTSDSAADTGSLRYAISQANANTNSAGSEIEFDPTFFATPKMITLSSTLELSEKDGPEVIDGPGASALTISGDNAVEVFLVDAGVTATLSGLTISGGMTNQSGGGISNAGTLSVTDCTISGNSTTTGAGGGGGGVYNAGTLTITGSTVSGNTATPQDYNAGGGIYSGGTLTVNACNISGNSANDGGAIFNVNDELTISDTTFSDNSAILVPNIEGDDGGIGGGAYDFGGKGMTVTDSIFSGNTAGGGGGGVDVYECPLTVAGTTLSSNTTAGNGGGINNFSSPLTVADTTLSNNTAGGGGGAFYDNGGTDTFTNSTLSGNSAAEGGGIFDKGDSLTAVNCTIVSNHVASAGDGGGLGVANDMTTLDNTIVALNTDGTGSDAPADDITSYSYYGSNPLSTASANNLIGTGGSGGLTNDTNGNLVGVADPGLDPNGLQWNGGPTQTIALVTGSHAIAAGSYALALSNALTTDQRGPGFARSVNGIVVDIGAFETGNATGYLVDLTSDTGAGSGGAGDLLYCITQANATTNTAGSLIEFAPTVFNTATPRTVKLSSTLELTETAGPEMIGGPGASALTINGNNAVQVFDVSQQNVTASLAGLTISGGMTNQDGGGIDNDGTLTVTNSTFTNNTSGGEGGAIFNPGMLTVTNSTIADNTAPFGGGIDNAGVLTVNGSTLESNTANNSGGFGGGIDNHDGGMATLTSTTVEMNSAVLSGGGIFNAAGSTLTVASSTLSDNTAASGGGIFNVGTGDAVSTVTVTDSTLSSNSSTGTSSGSGGGGLYNSDGSASITGSTLSGNSTYGTGGGIDEDSGSLTLTNSTIAGDFADGVGAGIHENSGTLTAVNCTIAYNEEPYNESGVGGGMDITDGTATLDNTIIALNTDNASANPPADNIHLDGSGTISSASAYNLLATSGNSGLTNGVNGNQVGVPNPGLGTLADNGGPTETIALLAGSPALGAGSNALAVDANGNTLTTDQRGAGFPRIVNGTVDIGAFERPFVGNPTVYTVDLTSDIGASTSALAGDILYCVTQANASTNLAGSEIEFDPMVFATPRTITLTSTLVLSDPSGPETIDDPAANLVTVSGDQAVQVFDVQAAAVMATLSGLIISDGSAPNGSGGGIGNSGTLTVTNCTLSGNSANRGGAIENGGTLTITNCTLSGNSAGNEGLGGGILNSGTLTANDCTISGNTAGFGGGVYNGGALAANDCTISGNTAVIGGGVDNNGPLTVLDSVIENNHENNLFAAGCGIYNDGGTATLINSTVAGNAAGSGGGIYVSGGALTAINCTIADNSAGNYGASGGGMDVYGGTVTLDNTIVALNTDGTGMGAAADDIAGAGVSGSYNLIGTGGSGGLTNGTDGNQVGVADPGLDPNGLQDNGGPTQTIALLAGSPAVDEGSNGLIPSGVTTDQRGTGFPRIVSDYVDIGAFELQTLTINNPVPSVSTILPDQIAIGHFSPITVTFIGSGFINQTAVDWNSTSLETTYVSSTELTAIVPASDIATIGTAAITVTNPPPVGGTAVAEFQILAAPTTVYVSPAYAGQPLGTSITWTDGSTHYVGYDAFGTIGAGFDSVARHGRVDIFVTSSDSGLDVEPNSGNATLAITLNGILQGSMPAGDALGFFGNGVLDIFGESGFTSNVFTIEDTSVQYDAADGLHGMSISLNGTGLTRNVIAEGTTNTFNIAGAGGSGPSGDLKGDAGTNAFVFSGSVEETGKLLGNITGSGSTTLDYSGYSTNVTVHLGNGTNGTATGASGTVSGITAVIGSNFNDTLDAGNVPNVALTGGAGTNYLSGTGAGDSVVENSSTNYYLADYGLDGTGENFTDYLSGIRIARLTGQIDGSSFDVSGWTGTGSLAASPGGIASVSALKNARFVTLTNAALVTSDGMSLSLSGITLADLNLTSSIIDASAFSGVANLYFGPNAIVFGGSGGHGTLSAASAGNDILIGEAANTTLTDPGSGRNILIGGGAGGDTLTGNGSDILVSGTTKYDSDTTANISALDAILAEWTSNASYAKRVQMIIKGVGKRNLDAFNSRTIRTNSNASNLSDRINQIRSTNWFLVSTRDSVTKNRKETKTII